MKTTKKIITLVLALALIFALAAPSFAVFGNTACYEQNALDNVPTITGTFTVYLTFISETRNGSYIGRYDLPVYMGASGVTDEYYVRDVLLAAQSQYSDWLTLYGNAYTVLTGSSTALVGVKDSDVSSTTIFGPVLSYSGRNGWMFRIDNKFPLLDPADWPTDPDHPENDYTEEDGPLGATIEQAYVQPNQHITFYFAEASSSSSATTYMKITSLNYNSNTKKLTINVSGSSSYYDTEANGFYWHISPFGSFTAPYGFYIIINGSSYYLANLNSGSATLSNVSPSSGEITVEIMPLVESYSYGGVNYGITTFTGAYATWHS